MTSASFGTMGESTIQAVFHKFFKHFAEMYDKHIYLPTGHAWLHRGKRFDGSHAYPLGLVQVLVSTKFYWEGGFTYNCLPGDG